MAACSGGGGDSSRERDPVGSDDRGGGSGSNVPVAGWGSWLDLELALADRDLDGIPDEHDAWPDDPPVLVDPSSAQSLTVRHAWTDIDGNVVDWSIVDGEPLQLHVDGLPASGGTTIWAVFSTGAGFRAYRGARIDEHTIVADAPADATGVHVVAGSARGMDRPLFTLDRDRPTLFSVDGSFRAGAAAGFAGRNLGYVDSALLGGNALRIIERSADRIVVELPAAASGNRLVLEAAGRPSNTLEIDLRREVELRPAGELALAQGERLAFRLSGEEHTLSHADPVTVSLPAWRPTVLSFNIVSGSEIRSYNRLRVVAWPGESQAVISADTSLAGRLYNVRHLLPGAGGSDWSRVRSSVESSLATQAGRDYAVALSEHAAGRAAPPDEALVVAALEAHRQLAAQANTHSKPAHGGGASMLDPATPFGDLDEAVGSVLDYFGQPSADKTDGGSGSSLHEPPSQTFGNDYAQVTVQRHGEASPIPFFPGACEYSVDEATWFTQKQLNADEFERVWRADLCVQVDGVVFVSAAVARPGFGDAEAIFDSAAAGGKPRGLARSHSPTSFVDYGTQWGPGGYYLRSDVGQPLCHMTTCYIEVITSGYGAYKNIKLTSEQQALVEKLRVRMWVEGLIPWIVGLTGDSGFNTLGVKGCIRDDLLSNGALYTAAGELADFLKAARHLSDDALVLAIYDGLDQKFAPKVRQYVQGQLGNRFMQCLSAVQPVDQALDAIKDRLLDKAGLSGFTEVVAFVSNLGSAVLTPEKFVFKIQPRAEVKSISPPTINLYNESASLVIEGDWLAQLGTGADPCTGDGWCPELVVVDQRGRANGTYSLQLDASHYSVPSNCGLACTRLTIPNTQLAGLQNLLGGPVTVELAIADASFSSYPDSKLRVPVPVDWMQLRTKAKLSAVHPPLAQSGETVELLGSSIDVYGQSAIFELVPDGGGPGIAMRKLGGTGSSEAPVRLRVPNAIAGYYRVVVRAGSDATESGLAPLESETQLLIATTNLQAITVGEQGRVKDDSVEVRLLDRNGSIVQTNPGLQNLLFLLPDADDNYVGVIVWDDNVDANNDYTEITARVAKFSIRCIDSGSDNTCTVGMRSLIDGICLTAQSPPRSVWSAKIPEGDTREFHLAPGAPGSGATCMEAEFP